MESIKTGYTWLILGVVILDGDGRSDSSSSSSRTVLEEGGSYEVFYSQEEGFGGQCFMPSRNRIKLYAPESYYHVYNRGVSKQEIFLDKKDYVVFTSLLKRYLAREISFDRQARPYPNLYNEADLLAFCLLPNHFHLLIYQVTIDAMTKLMRGLCTSYTMYFNKRYKRSGPLFQERFKASLINRDSYIEHISRYIHLNPSNYKEWQFTSLPYYLGNKHAEWVRPEFILALFKNKDDYLKFLEDYEDYRKVLKEIKNSLADH